MFLISRIHSRKPEGINVTPDTDVVKTSNCGFVNLDLYQTYSHGPKHPNIHSPALSSSPQCSSTDNKLLGLEHKRMQGFLFAFVAVVCLFVCLLLRQSYYIFLTGLQFSVLTWISSKSQWFSFLCLMSMKFQACIFTPSWECSDPYSCAQYIQVTGPYLRWLP